LEEADLLCDRVAILVEGRITKVDSPRVLKAAAEEESVVEFSFEGGAPGLSVGLSNRLPGVKIVAVDHDRVRIYGGILADVYDSVLQFAKDKGIEIYSINSIKPSLEDAFIKITGLSPVVMAVEKGGR
jgi:ABC-2 type transport system ATP-binding protein